MERIEKLEAEFQGVSAKDFLSPHLAFTKAGISLGAGCVIAPLRTSAGGKQTHDLSGEDRILALLSFAFGRSINPEILEKLQHASEIFAQGDPCLASIHLAQLRIPRLDQEHQAWSLYLADRLIESGYAPLALGKALGFELPETLRKFNPDQPRDDHGRWTSGEGSAVDESVIGGRSVSEKPAAPLPPPRPPGMALSFAADHVNPTNDHFNCGHIIDAVVARLRGTNPDATAPAGYDGTWDQIAERLNTKFYSISILDKAFQIIESGGNGAMGVVGMDFSNNTAHVVIIANDLGRVGIVEGQDAGQNSRGVISDSESANALYNYDGQTRFRFGILPRAQ